jgi:hypothetical protein
MTSFRNLELPWAMLQKKETVERGVEKQRNKESKTCIHQSLYFKLPFPYVSQCQHMVISFVRESGGIGTQTVGTPYHEFTRQQEQKNQVFNKVSQIILFFLLVAINNLNNFYPMYQAVVVSKAHSILNNSHNSYIDRCQRDHWPTIQQSSMKAQAESKVNQAIHRVLW